MLEPDKGTGRETRDLNRIRQRLTLGFSTIQDQVTAIALMQLAYRAGQQSAKDDLRRAALGRS